jgi:type II secretory pathway component PulJ
MHPTRNHRAVYSPCSQGFSFVEMMVAMSIVMVVIAALLSSYIFLGRNLVRCSNEQQLEAQSRRALQMLGQEVRMAQDVSYAGTVPYNPNDSSWQTMPTAGQVTLYLSVPNGTNPSYNYTAKYVYDLWHAAACDHEQSTHPAHRCGQFQFQLSRQTGQSRGQSTQRQTNRGARLHHRHGHRRSGHVGALHGRLRAIGPAQQTPRQVK